MNESYTLYGDYTEEPKVICNVLDIVPIIPE